MSLIELKHVSKAFGRLVVLDDLSLSIERGQSLVVIGASGTGKSVLLKHIVGLLKPDDGEVYFAGQRVDLMPERQLMELRQRFGFLFQMGALFDSLTVGENIAFPLQEHTHKPPGEVRQIVAHRLGMVGLPGIERARHSAEEGDTEAAVACDDAGGGGDDPVIRSLFDSRATFRRPACGARVSTARVLSRIRIMPPLWCRLSSLPPQPERPHHNATPVTPPAPSPPPRR
jgi:phospholipid/cholesterol/gamma-HCH transport system ATP-binding protein